MANVTLEEVKKNPLINTFIQRANAHLGVMGFTEHGHRHANLVASIAHNILERLGHPPRICELAAIAGYIHDIGNVVARENHSQSGGVLAIQILLALGMEAEEVAVIAGAVGNHEEPDGQPVNEVSAAVILADKSDVHRSRVRNPDIATFDIHDRVSYAAGHSFLKVNPEEKTVTLELTIDTEICPVMDYFEIFLTRMIMCRRAAELLGCKFKLVINGAKLL